MCYEIQNNLIKPVQYTYMDLIIKGAIVIDFKLFFISVTLL